jgi:vitamin B12 transporter
MSTAVFFLLFFHARAIVVDPSGRPIEGANVSCSNQTASTSATGEVDLTGSCRVSKPGFETATTELNSNSRLTLRLSPQSERVTVTATGVPVLLEEAGVSATVFTPKDFEPSRGPFVQGLLRDVPGLQVVQTGQNGGIVSLFARGGSSSSTLVLMDGIPVTEPGGYLDFVHLTSPGLDRVEVVRGPESVLFGAEASSAVVQITTHHGDPESSRPHGTLVYERGSFSTDHWSTSVDGGLLRKFDYALTADQYRTTGEFPNDAYRLASGTANLGYAITERTHLRASFREFDSYTGAPGATYYGLFNLDANNRDRDSVVNVRLDDARGSRYVQRFIAGYHRYHDRFSDIRMENYTVYGIVDAQGFYRPASPGTPGVLTEKETLYPFSSASFTNRTTAGYQGTLTHTRGALVLGYEFERQAGTISSTGVDRRNHGFFIHEQYALTPRIFLTGGARLEHSSTFGEKFAPRGSVTFRLPAETYLRFSAARGIQEPSLLNNFAKESYYVGNPALRPEKTTSIEAGLSREWLHGRVRTEAAYFHNSFTDLIQYTSVNYVGTWINIDQSRAQGMDATATVKLHRNVSIRGGYARLDTRITKSATASLIGTEFARRARNTGTLALELTPRRWNLTAGARFAGERADNDYVFGVTRNPSFQEVFFHGSFRVNKHVSPFFRMGNALDQKYQEALGYQALSRNAYGGVKMTW